MTRRTLLIPGLLILAFAWACSPLIAAEAAPSDVTQAALTFANGLATGDLTAGWKLLSPQSKARINAVQWEEAFRSRPTPRMPSGNDLLKALAVSPTPPTIGGVVLKSGEALIQVGGSVRITQRLVLVKEGGKWVVDLPASDELNSRDAAQVFLEAVVAAAPPTTPRPVRTTETALPMLRAVLAPEAKNFTALDTSVQGDRAEVTLASDLPVSIVLRAIRTGAGWTVDLSRPFVQTDPLSPDPLKEAEEASIQAACQDQLRQLGRAMQMYAAANDDTLPDAAHWLERIRPFLGGSAGVHCPADNTPGVSYAMNRNLSGKKRSQIGNQPTTPLLYESSLHTANPADTGESWPTVPFHAAGNNVLFLDGSARAAPQKPTFAVTEGQRPATPPTERPLQRRQPGQLRPQ